MTAVVIGAQGGIGAALADALAAGGQPVLRLGRTTTPRLDLLDEASIAAAAAVAGPGLRLVIDATGPALLMKHFLPLLSREGPAVFATLSARVGSISDNRLGGWHAYRAAKAALNQLMRTAAIELARTRPLAVCVALHPGTVDTGLSAPFAKTGLDVQTPAQAAARLLEVIAGLAPGQTGGFFDHHEVAIPF